MQQDVDNQLDLPFDPVPIRQAAASALDRIDTCIRDGSYGDLVQALALFSRIVWDAFYRKPG